jgi:hypothetical protein
MEDWSRLRVEFPATAWAPLNVSGHVDSPLEKLLSDLIGCIGGRVANPLGRHEFAVFRTIKRDDTTRIVNRDVICFGLWC